MLTLRPTLRLSLTIVLALEASAQAATIKGSVERPTSVPPSRALGHTKTQVTAPAPEVAGRRQSMAIFLAAKDSLPLPKPEAPPQVRVVGLGLEPAVAACPVDGQVVFTNEDKRGVTLRIGGDLFVKLEPGASKAYECTAGTPGREFRAVKVDEWPHIRGWVYVGDLGVSAEVQDLGQFQLSAPEGSYALRFVGEGSITGERPLTVAKTDIDLGRIDLSGNGPVGNATTGGPASVTDGKSATPSSTGARRVGDGSSAPPQPRKQRIRKIPPPAVADEDRPEPEEPEGEAGDPEGLSEPQ